MKKLSHTILILVIVASLAISYTSCTQSTPELLPMSENPAKAEVLAGDYDALSDRLSELEKRVEHLEQGLDERGTGKRQAANTELHKIQTAALAAMADAQVGTIARPGVFDDTTDVTVSGITSVGDFIVGYPSADAVHGTYTIAADGTVAQTAYP